MQVLTAVLQLNYFYCRFIYSLYFWLINYLSIVVFKKMPKNVECQKCYLKFASDLQRKLKASCDGWCQSKCFINNQWHTPTVCHGNNFIIDKLSSCSSGEKWQKFTLPAINHIVNYSCSFGSGGSEICKKLWTSSHWTSYTDKMRVYKAVRIQLQVWIPAEFLRQLAGRVYFSPDTGRRYVSQEIFFSVLVFYSFARFQSPTCHKPSHFNEHRSKQKTKCEVFVWDDSREL